MFQVDLWSARGDFPRNMADVDDAAEGDPIFEPHARQHRPVQELQRLQRAVGSSLSKLPEDLREQRGRQAPAGSSPITTSTTSCT